MLSPARVLGGKLFRVVVTSTSSLTTVVVVPQSPGSTQAGLSGPPGTRLLTAAPASVAVALTTTFADAPGARPAGTLHASAVPATGAQVAGAWALTTTFARPAGKVSARLTLPVLAPVPLLFTVKVHVMVSPTLTVALSTVFFTVTFGRVTVVVVWHAAAVAQAGLSGPDGTTLLATVPAAFATAFTTMLASAPAARPAATVQLSVVPTGTPQLAGATGRICSAPTLAGKLSVRVTGAVVGPLPLLRTRKVQLMVSPRLTVALSTPFVTATLGLVTVLVVAQSPGVAQAGLSGPDGTTLLA